ncbi:MAG: hypothetical protein IPK97_02620 [Ahniella sp.]|nr:hypothetical protein [Ahniella sp.]
MARAILIALVIAVVVAIFLPRSGQRADGDKVPAEVRSQLRGHKVVMLSASWCGYCKTLRNDLRAAKVPFKVLDIEETATGRKVADALNVQAVGDDRRRRCRLGTTRIRQLAKDGPSAPLRNARRRLNRRIRR